MVRSREHTDPFSIQTVLSLIHQERSLLHQALSLWTEHPDQTRCVVSLAATAGPARASHVVAGGRGLL